MFQVAPQITKEPWRCRCLRIYKNGYDGKAAATHRGKCPLWQKKDDDKNGDSDDIPAGEPEDAIEKQTGHPAENRANRNGESDEDSVEEDWEDKEGRDDDGNSDRQAGLISSIRRLARAMCACRIATPPKLAKSCRSRHKLTSRPACSKPASGSSCQRSSRHGSCRDSCHERAYLNMSSH